MIISQLATIVKIDIVKRIIISWFFDSIKLINNYINANKLLSPRGFIIFQFTLW